MKPTKDIVLIKADKPKEATASGILLADTWKTYPHTGEVIAVGPDVVGDLVGKQVIFERYGAIRVLEEAEDLRMCKESHVLAIINS